MPAASPSRPVAASVGVRPAQQPKTPRKRPTTQPEAAKPEPCPAGHVRLCPDGDQRQGVEYVRPLVYELLPQCDGLLALTQDEEEHEAGEWALTHVPTGGAFMVFANRPNVLKASRLVWIIIPRHLLESTVWNEVLADKAQREELRVRLLKLEGRKP